MSERDEFEAAMGWKLKDSQGKHALSRAHDSQQTYTFLATYWAYEAWQAARATPQQAVPDGWKLVPVEPTREMWAAFNKLDDEMAAGSYDGTGCSFEQGWNCMLAAAPQPESR